MLALPMSQLSLKCWHPERERKKKERIRMLEENEEARTGCRLEEQVVTECSRHKKEQEGTMPKD